MRILVLFLLLWRASPLAASDWEAEAHDGWRSGAATYSEDPAAGESSGACGYGDLFGRSLAAVSGALFRRGRACGGCFELRCVDHVLWCLPGSPSTVVTAGDFCPPNYALAADSGGWCNFPQVHFQLPQPSFLAIAESPANLVPIQYRRVKCERSGGVRLTMSGSGSFFQMLVWNVGSDGELAAVKVKGSRTGWISMARNWGQNWHCAADLSGQPLSFELTTAASRSLTSYNVAPADWTPGQTFHTKKQFN
ncbi:expansin A20 [Wolffia australiana]